MQKGRILFVELLLQDVSEDFALVNKLYSQKFLPLNIVNSNNSVSRRTCRRGCE
ncbi:unnamed protein product [Amoebophrya sp. A120]|nr:unnamed protein product [Amoebophrya sp. A120]|eukprot:GSA120T00006899001.1